MAVAATGMIPSGTREARPGDLPPRLPGHPELHHRPGRPIRDHLRRRGGRVEWSWGTLKAWSRGESRSRYILLTFAAVAAYLLAGIAFSFVIGVAAAFVGANVAGVPTDGMSDSDAIENLPELFGRGWYTMAEQGAIGFAVATVARSQLAGIGIGIALYFGEAFAGIFLPDIVRYLPFNVANAAVGLGDGGFGGGPNPVPQDAAMLLVGAWLLGSLIVAAVFSERADITG